MCDAFVLLLLSDVNVCYVVVSVLLNMDVDVYVNVYVDVYVHVYVYVLLYKDMDVYVDVRC